MDSFYSCFYSLSLCPQLIARHDTLEYEIRVIVIWVITHNVWTWSQSSHRASGHNRPPASCCLCRTAGTYSCKKFSFSSILLCKILQSKCCSVSHWVFISPTEIRSGVSNIQGLELSEAMKILYNFHPFLPMRNPSVLPSALLAWYPRTLGHPQLCARAGISLYPVSAPRLSVTRAAVSVRSPDQAVGGTTCDPSPYIVKNI